MTPVVLLPRLRQDLELITGKDEAGQPTYLIRDVIQNRYVEISADTCALLANWAPGIPVGEFVSRVAVKGIMVDEVEVESFISFLTQSELVIRGIDDELKPQKALLKRVFEFSLHNYLFFRIPLFYPDAFLKRSSHWMGVFGKPAFWIVTGLVFLFDLMFIGARWDAAVAQLSGQTGLALSLKFALAFIVSKAAHELAHAYAASRKGCVVGSLGIGFILGFPVFYADVTDSWRLTHRKDRLLVACAGLAAELTIGVYAIAIWVANPASGAASVFLYLGLAIWVSSIVVNANPLIRFDGYHILCDLLGEKNFQETAFASARSIYRWLLGFGPRPQITQWRYPVYGFSAMVYRIVVVTGIAWFLYNFSFRLLGLGLFALEIWWFLLRPVYVEYVRLRREQIPFTATGRGLHIRLGVVAGLLLLLIVPFSTQVSAPAVATFEHVSRVFLRDGARAGEALTLQRRMVDEGASLLSIDDPGRQAMVEETRVSLSILERRRAAVTVADVDRSRVLALEAEIAREKAKLAALMEGLAALTPRAAFAGTFVPLEPIENGRWLSARSPIGDVVAGRVRFIGFVSERELARVRDGVNVTFIRDHDSLAIQGRVISVNYAAEASLPFPELATSHGGWIEARLNNNILVSDHAIYRIEGLADVEAPLPSSRSMGTLLIRSEARSLLGRFALWVASLLRREARLS